MINLKTKLIFTMAMALSLICYRAEAAQTPPERTLESPVETFYHQSNVTLNHPTFMLSLQQPPSTPPSMIHSLQNSTRQGLLQVPSFVIPQIATSVAMAIFSASISEGVQGFPTATKLVRATAKKMGILKKDLEEDIIPELNKHEKAIKKALQEKKVLELCNGTEEDLKKYDSAIESIIEKQNAIKNQIKEILLKRAHKLKEMYTKDDSDKPSNKTFSDYKLSKPLPPTSAIA